MSRLWSPICDQLGIETPIFGFAHDVATVAAISRAGGYGVYGATRRFPQEIRDELAEIRSLVGDKPFGVDILAESYELTSIQLGVGWAKSRVISITNQFDVHSLLVDVQFDLFKRTLNQERSNCVNPRLKTL